MQTLQALGRRVCIFGPSNAGKSTLAVALGEKLGVPAIHLELFHHLLHTDWVQRPPDEFERMHNEAIAGDGWVMDGNYSRLIPKRLKRLRASSGSIRRSLEISGAISAARCSNAIALDRSMADKTDSND